MYKEHFAVERPLFSDGVARDTDVFLGPRQQLTAANLKIALSTRDSVAVLSGPAGVGKTTIASYAVRAATTRLALGWLGSAPLTPHELLEQLLTGFEFTPYKSSRVERMQVWRQFLNEMSITDTRVCVLVENAEEYTTEVMRALGSLTGADPNGCPGANLVLTSALPARELLAAQGLEALKQRMRLSARVEPFNPAEMEAYLRQRCSLAGARYEEIFAAGTATAVQHFSGGLLRVANNLCETALTVAATRKEALLRPELLTRVAVGLFGMEPPSDSMPAEPASKAAGPTTAQRRHPIVGERAVATAAMMAAEASLEQEADDAEETEDEAAQGMPAAVATTAVQSEHEPVRALDASEQTPDAPERASPTSEPDSAPVPTTSDEAAESLSADDGDPAADFAAEEPEAEPETASTIEFVAESGQPDPFAVDEGLMTDATDDADSEAIDLPVLTDSVEPDGDVAAAIMASGDDDTGDAALASALADFGDPDERLDPSLEADAIDVDDGLVDDLEAEATARKREAQAAFAHAKALEDISNSMAETLFGDAELAELSATLAIASSDDDDGDELALSLELESDDETPARSRAS